MYKIGILIPTTTAKRDWKTFEDTTFFNVFLHSFTHTYCNEHTYIIYLVIDDDDKIFANKDIQSNIKSLTERFKNVKLKYISSQGITKSHITEMWNRAFLMAYGDGCEYFFQSGDDIWFETKGWVTNSIEKLKQHNDIGLTGPTDVGRFKFGVKDFQPGGERFIHTQSFVSRKHMEIFGFYFPKEIKNWFCDDWITKIYYPEHFYLINHQLRNIGGVPRYNIVSQSNWKDLVKRDREILTKYLQKSS